MDNFDSALNLFVSMRGMCVSASLMVNVLYSITKSGILFVTVFSAFARYTGHEKLKTSKSPSSRSSRSEKVVWPTDGFDSRLSSGLKLYSSA